LDSDNLNPIGAFRGKEKPGHVCLSSAIMFTDPLVKYVLANSADYFAEMSHDGDVRIE
jgi:hypothetical protein